MGALKRLNQEMKKIQNQTRLARLHKELREFMASHMVSPWQKDRVNEIRALYERKMKDYEQKWHQGREKITEEFMQYEIDFLYASDHFKKENPGKEWHPSGVAGLGVMARSFWNQLIEKGKALGMSFNNQPHATNTQGK